MQNYKVSKNISSKNYSEISKVSHPTKSGNYVRKVIKNVNTDSIFTEMELIKKISKRKQKNILKIEDSFYDPNASQCIIIT